MSDIIPNLEDMTDAEKKAALDAIQLSIAKSKEVQKQRIGENVNLVIDALKKIESDIQSRYDLVGNTLEKRVASIKDGKDGKDGRDGKNGKDGRDGKQGVQGAKGENGRDGRDGVDGSDGVGVSFARIDFDGSLVIGLSSGVELNVGEVVAPDLAERIKVITNGGGTSQSVLDTLASLQTQIDDLIPSQTGNSGKFLTTNGTSTSWASVAGGLNFQGTWNASTNTPTLASGVGVNGYYYITATAGSTNLDGITDWQIGDWLIFNGTVWQKIDQSNLVTSVNGQTGAVSVGTVTSVAATAGTGISVSGSPITTSGTLTITNTAPDQTVVLTAGTGISTSGTYPNFTVTNSAPDQTVALTGAGTTSITGTYPNFTITSNDAFTGTVTSVTGISPVASSGGATPAISLSAGYGDTLNPYASKTANFVLAAPNGSAGVPTFRAVVAADIPTLNQNTTGTASNVTGTVAIANGGTGQTTANTAFNALAPSQTSNSGKYLTTDGTNSSWATVSADTVGFKNRIINGAMVIDQRNAGASVTPSSNGTYTLDRWNITFSQASKFTIQQTPSATETGYATRVGAGFTNYLGATVASSVSVGSGDYFALQQLIEGLNVADLAWGTANAKTITLSFWVRSSLTGTFGGALSNSAGDRSYPYSYTISSANTWEQKTITIAGDTSGTWLTTNGVGMYVRFGLGAGSTYSGTAGSWAASNYFTATGAVSVVGTGSATFYITGVQLEKGSTATSFDYRPYGTELQLCQRYFYKIVGSSSAFAGLGSGVVTGGTTARAYIKYPVNARTSPTVSFGGTVYVYDGGNGVVTSVNINAGDQSCSVDFTCSGGGLTTGRGCVPNTANASTDFLQFSAEL